MRSSAHWIIGLLAVACALPCRADDDADDALLEAPLEVRGQALASNAPRLTRTELPVDESRSLPGFRAEATELSYRWWKSSGRADVGIGLGTLAYAVRPDGLPGRGASYAPGDPGAAAVIGAGTVLTLGMRYRTSERSTLYADAAGVHARGLDGGDALVGKVGVEFKSAQSRWNIAYGGLGLHLDGDTRMTLKLRKGGLAVFMRRVF